MDISTGLGLVFGGIVLVALIMMGGDLRMFLDLHAFIVIFGGATAATLIRFPLSSIFHGLPMGMKFAFSMRRWSSRELVDEIARLAEIARKQGPIGLLWRSYREITVSSPGFLGAMTTRDRLVWPPRCGR